MHINKNIKHLRLHKKLSQAQLAEEIGVTRAMIQSYELNTEPTISTLSKLAIYFSITIEELINNDLEYLNTPVDIKKKSTEQEVSEIKTLEDKIKSMQAQLDMKDDIIKAKEETIEVLKTMLKKSQ